MAYTPLHDAAYGSKVDVVRKLLQEGADAKAKDSNGVTPLHLAAEYNPNATICELLIQHGAEVNVAATELSGITPLHRAAQNPNPQICELLLKHGADVHQTDSQNRTALDFAARSRNPEICALLIEKGCDPNRVSQSGFTALHHAASIDPNPKILELLLQHGADVKKTTESGSTALNIAAYADGLEQAEFMELLIENGAIVDAPGYKGSTTMRSAVFKEKPGIVALLLKYGARSDLKDDDGITALELARTPHPYDEEGTRVRLQCADLITQSVVCFGMSAADACAKLAATDNSDKTTLFLTNVPDLAELPELLRTWPRLHTIVVTNCPLLKPASAAAAVPPTLTTLELMGTAPFSLDILKDCALHRLKTNCCTLARLPDGCTLAQSLQKLDLSGSSISELPVWIYSLPALVELMLAGCPLTSLPRIAADVPITRTLTARADHSHTHYFERQKHASDRPS
eukprot:TRINITY_DN2491_c0_g2_i1.p1 TRINITY_DN2491_c0_g2~~TRINITY_DN2491_c0_g2_i1.p1  ORF type:complete len:473 (-),score=102.15 TRINITY_DN2491_c0_g2_i1:636-2012(-)